MNLWVRLESEAHGWDSLGSGFGEKARLGVFLEHLSAIEDTRELHRVAYPLAELLLLTLCGTIADCDDYEAIADWGEQHLAFLRQFLPYHHGVPSGRWLTIMLNRINSALFSACFTGWVRACWPDRDGGAAVEAASGAFGEEGPL